MKTIRDELSKITKIHFNEEYTIERMMSYLHKEGLLDSKTILQIVSMLCDRMDKLENVKVDPLPIQQETYKYSDPVVEPKPKVKRKIKRRKRKVRRKKKL